MYKLAPFQISHHRFVADEPLSEKIKEIGLQYKTVHPEFANLLLASEHEEKLHLLLKVMVSNYEDKFHNLTYQIRLVNELNTILNHEEDYILDFFLIYEDIASWFTARNEIAMIGRGAASGSLINYLLNITKVDPIKCDLLFSRWLDTYSSPLIDIDCDSKSAVELKEYLAQQYPGYYKEVLIDLKYKLKGCIKDGLRNHGFKSVEFEQEFMKVIDSYESLRNQPSLVGRELRSSEKAFFNYIYSQNNHWQTFFTVHPEIKSYILTHLDSIRSVGRHAAGIVLTDSPLTKLEEFHKDGIVVINILRLSAYEEINKKYKLSDLPSLDFDILAKQSFTDSRSGGFLENTFEYYQKHLKEKLAVNCLKDAAQVLALSRHNLMFLSSGATCPVDDIRVTAYLKDTNNQLIYQEQLMQIISDCLDISLSDARNILKAISNGSDKFIDYKDQYVLKTGENGQEIWDYLELVAPYCFNKAHSFSYAMVDCLSIK